MAMSYYIDRNKKNIRKVNDIVLDLPSFCSLFIIGIENNTTPLTRLNYVRDLQIFFNYLILYEKKNIGLFDDEIKSITLRSLEKVDSLLIERFLSYTSLYDDESNRVHINGEKGKSRKLSTLRSFFGFYFNKNLLPSNVAAKVATPKDHLKSIIRLEDDEVSNMLRVSENPTEFSAHQRKYLSHCSIRDNAIITLLLGTGIRVSECVGLNIDDLDFSNNSFKVIRKGGNQSILYFSDELSDVLGKYIRYRKAQEVNENEQALFLSLQNKRLGVRSIENLVKKYALIISPLKNISPHKLRSTYGTALYRETQDIYVVADVLGHKDINTTKKHYAAISEDIRKNAANKVKLRK